MAKISFRPPLMIPQAFLKATDTTLLQSELWAEKRRTGGEGIPFSQANRRAYPQKEIL
jgi:hypothetical protein